MYQNIYSGKAYLSISCYYRNTMVLFRLPRYWEMIWVLQTKSILISRDRKITIDNRILQGYFDFQYKKSQGCQNLVIIPGIAEVKEDVYFQ